jgi:hypothetical protein
MHHIIVYHTAAQQRINCRRCQPGTNGNEITVEHQSQQKEWSRIADKSKTKASKPNKQNVKKQVKVNSTSTDGCTVFVSGRHLP